MINLSFHYVYCFSKRKQENVEKFFLLWPIVIEYCKKDVF